MTNQAAQHGRRRWLWGGLVLLILGGGAAAFLLLSLRGGTIPSGTPSGTLSFISSRGENWDIYLLDANGTLSNLTAGDPFDDYFSSWDFASARINFLSYRAGEIGPTQVQPDGGGLRSLGILDAVTTMFFEGRLDWDPAWSADGAQVAWSSLRDLNLELYAAPNAPDAPPQRLTSHPARDWFAAWSPDGAQLAFASDRAGAEDIYLMNADGTNLRQLTTHPANDVHPVWSLDGQRLLFVSERVQLLDTGLLDLYVIEALNSDTSTVRALGADEVFEGDPTWSADGREMVYMSNVDGTWSLYLRDEASGEVRRLTDAAADDLFPVWRPAE